MSLASLTLFKTLWGSTGLPEDPQAQAFLDSASAAIEAYCMRVFASTSYTEYYSGTGSHRLALRQRPVTSVTLVRVDTSGAFGKRADSFDSTTALEEGTDWVLDYSTGQTSSKSGILFRIGTVWPMVQTYRVPSAVTVDQGPALGNIKVSYTAGYSSIPADLQHATCLLASHMIRAFKLGGYVLMKERIGDYSYALGEINAKRPELGSVNATLSRYREMGW